MQWLPFNLFQRLIRTWEQVHPYNAAQALTLEGEADVSRITVAWDAALGRLGLGLVICRQAAYAHVCRNGERRNFDVTVLSSGASLEKHLTAALNERFDDHEPPFRPFIKEGDGEFQIGLVYRHWVADSVSIRMVMRAWCDGILGRTSPPAPQMERRGYWHLYGPGRTPLAVDQAALGLVRSYMRMRTVRKAPLTGAGDYPTCVCLHLARPALIDDLRRAMPASLADATVGDVLQAALAVAAHRHLPLQCRPRRRDVAVGSIADLRPSACRDLSDTFGMHLGFTHVVCRRQNMPDFIAIARSVAAQNRAHRRQGVAGASLAWMIAATVAHRRGRPEKMYRFYRKEIPLAAGLSSVNLNGQWPSGFYPSPVRGYLRVSPTGPMAPMALSATTLGDRLALALTYRPAILSPADARAIAQTFVDLIEGVIAHVVIA